MKIYIIGQCDIYLDYFPLLKALYVAFNPYSAGIDFRRRSLTAKVDSRTVRMKIFIMAVDP